MSLQPSASSDRILGCTCTRVRRLARRISQVYDRALAPVGLKVTQYALLSTLASRDAQPIGVLAESLDMDRTSLTRTLKPLLANGLVVLVQGDDDARVRCVHLTDRGRALRLDAKKLWRAAQDETNRRIGDRRVAELHKLFDGLIDDFNASRETQ